MAVQKYGAEPAEIEPDPKGEYIRYEDYEKILRALKTTSQANRELLHAMECGPAWYTKGFSGMYSQCWTWLRKGLSAANPYEEEMAELLRDSDD